MSLMKEYHLGRQCTTLDEYLLPSGCASRRDQVHRDRLSFLEEVTLGFPFVAFILPACDKNSEIISCDI